VPSPYSAAHARPRQIAFLALTAALLLSLLAVVRPTIAAPVDAGFIDHSYGTGVGSPTEDKPQSKVWFADGSWWGGLFVDGDHEYRIHKYNATNNTWAATSTVVDERNSSHADYLWDGSSLYVASVNGDSDLDPILVFKYTYNAGSDTYTLDPDFQEDHDGDLDLDAGLIVGQGPAETVTIAKDSTDQLWVTFDNPVDATNREIMVNRSTTNEHTWGTAFQVGENVGPDDISAIIAYGNTSVGVLMSEHRDGDPTSAFHFFSHADSQANDMTWTGPNSIADIGMAEDHINLKLTATSGGDVLAALKTNDGPNHIQLYRRATNGTWSEHTVVGGGQSVTRPQVVVDETNDQVYVLYTAPESSGAGDQAIFYKSAPLDTLSFTSTGLGTALIADEGQDISDVSTAKHGVTSTSGLLAIASADSNTSYYHGFLALSGSGGSPFLDVPTTHRFFEDIVWIHDEGITTGCGGGGTLFCPEDNVDRDQMATFLVRTLGLTGGGNVNAFTDDNGNPHERNINILAFNGLTTGCGGGGTKYCPDDPVRRDQMATFLVRAYELTGGGSINAFTDDNGNTHERNINILANNELTVGCNPAGTRYCPARIVSRGQMAAFLHRAETQ
jgi:S-layer homology domain